MNRYEPNYETSRGIIATNEMKSRRSLGAQDMCVCGQIEVTLILAMDQNAQHMNHRIKDMDHVGAWQVDTTLMNLKAANSQTCATELTICL
jgi:hypothetical protein